MTKFIVEFHPDALEEVEVAKDWYAERSFFASMAFISELNHAVDRIIDAPEMYPVYEANSRRYIFSKFPFSLIYRIRKRKIQIIAVAHSKRKPGYWIVR